MRRFLLSSMVAAITLASATAQAAGVGANATGTFVVTIGLTGNCAVTNAAAPMAFTYTSFQGTAATASTSLNVKCTTSLPFSLALDTLSHLDATTQLTYDLALPVASGTGTGADAAFTVNGSIASGQGGTCAAGVCDNSLGGDKTRTLTVSY